MTRRLWERRPRIERRAICNTLPKMYVLELGLVRDYVTDAPMQEVELKARIAAAEKKLAELIEQNKVKEEVREHCTCARA